MKVMFQALEFFSAFNISEIVLKKLLLVNENEATLENENEATLENSTDVILGKIKYLIDIFSCKG